MSSPPPFPILKKVFRSTKAKQLKKNTSEFSLIPVLKLFWHFKITISTNVKKHQYWSLRSHDSLPDGSQSELCIAICWLVGRSLSQLYHYHHAPQTITGWEPIRTLYSYCYLLIGRAFLITAVSSRASNLEVSVTWSLPLDTIIGRMHCLSNSRWKMES